MSSVPNLEELSLVAESLRGANLQSRSVEWIRAQLAVLYASYTAIGIDRSAEQVWYRARKCNAESGFSLLQDCIYPSAGSIAFGRANLPGLPVLYASWNTTTAFDEVGAEPGDYIQVIAVRPRTGIQFPCHIVGEYQSIINLGGSLVNLRKLEQFVSRLFHDEPASHPANLYIDSFFADSFRRRVERPYEYKTTALFAERFLAKGGLMYPSVQNAGGINIAVPADAFDSKFEVISTEFSRIDRFYGYGTYQTTPLKQSCDFASDGTINWDSSKRLPARWNMQEGLRTTEPFDGWRKG